MRDEVKKNSYGRIIVRIMTMIIITYTIIQSIMRSEMCSLHLTHPSVHTWSSGQPTVQRPGSSRGLPVGAGIRTHNLPLASGFKSNALSISPTTAKFSAFNPSEAHTHLEQWAAIVRRPGEQLPCSRALQTQFLPARDSNPQTSGYRPDSLTIRPRLPL